MIDSEVLSVWTEERLNKTNILFYMPSINRFADSQWYVVHDLNQLFDTWQLDQWKKARNDIVMRAKNGTMMELSCLSLNEEDEVLEFISWYEAHGIKMDRKEFGGGC